jgi:hypothetical protein
MSYFIKKILEKEAKSHCLCLFLCFFLNVVFFFGGVRVCFPVCLNTSNSLIGDSLWATKQWYGQEHRWAMWHRHKSYFLMRMDCEPGTRPRFFVAIMVQKRTMPFLLLFLLKGCL